MNNFERIKQMSIDEMVEMLTILRNCDYILCNDCSIKAICGVLSHGKSLKQYLLQEVEE